MSRLRTVRARVFAAAFTAFVLTLPVIGQVSSGTMSGLVTDATGAVVPGAKVVLTNTATNATRDTVANGSGYFDFIAVQPATYNIEITAQGFTPWEEKGIAFSQAANVNLPNIVLQVGSTRQQVEVVSANDVVVPTDTGQSSQTLNEHMITDLAIQGRDAAELIKIMPGMGMNAGLSQKEFSSLVTQSNTGPIGSFSAQGTQPYGGMTMTMDGANLLDPGNQGTQTANINQNQIQEVSILTNAYGAEFAKGPVTFQAIGKSGSSQFHGDAYFYARNGQFNSEDAYLKTQGVGAPQDSYYYPGGDIGGPVLLPFTHYNKNHDKLFFYAAYEYMNQNPEGNLLQYFVPTQEMMQGNFSPAYLATLGTNIKNGPFAWALTPPCSGGCTATSGGAKTVTYPGGIIPQSALDPNSAALYATMPKPNVNPATNPEGADFQYLEVLPVNRWELRLRGDWNISENTKVYFSWNRQDETDDNPISIWWSTGHDLPYPSSMPANQVSQVYNANVTHVFSPTLTNEFIYAQASFLNPIAPANPAAVDPAKVGFSMAPLFNNTYATKQIPDTLSWGGLPGYFAPTFGQQFEGGDFGKYSNTPNISDNLSKVVGTHTLKFGFYWDFARNWQTASNFLSPGQGLVEFETYGANSTGNLAADFATGRVESFSQTNTQPVQNLYYHQYSFYANDQWKASRRLTLTLGIRFDHMGNWIAEGSNGLAVWNPSTYVNTSAAGAFTGLEWNSIDKAIPPSGFPSPLFFYEPRIGVAYDLFGTGKTVLRGGFGIYRYQLSGNDVGGAFGPPAGQVSETTTWNCCIGYNSFNQFSPSLGPAGLGTDISGIFQEGDGHVPYTETYNFTISQRAPWNSLAEIQYSGNHTYDQILNSGLSNIDKIPIGAFFGADPLTGVVNNPYSSSFPTNDYYPYHNYTGIQLVEHGSYSNYNGLIATWQKQAGRGTFTTNYAWSKVMGIRDGYSGNGSAAGPAVNPFCLTCNYGVLAYDHTGIFNAGYVINLPSPVHNNWFLAGAVNGWEFSGITQWQSGAPIQPNSANGVLNATYGNVAAGAVGGQQYLGTNAFTVLPPILTCDPTKNLKSGQYFNPSCFAPPAPGQIGPSVWPYIKGPAFFDSDLSLFKNFSITERQKVQFRFEAFNFLNHPLPTFNAAGNNADLTLRFSNSAGQLTQGNQNQITNGSPEYETGRRVVEFAVKYSF